MRSVFKNEDVIQEILDLSNPEQKKEEEDLKEEEILEVDSKSRWKSHFSPAFPNNSK